MVHVCRADRLDPREGPRHRHRRPRARPGPRAVPRPAGHRAARRARATPASRAVADLPRVDPLDGAAVAALAAELGADLVVVGPEAPLVAGVADAVRDAGIACFGPSRGGRQLEGSKAFAKQVMAGGRRADRAARTSATTADEVDDALDAFGPPYVVKDDGSGGRQGRRRDRRPRRPPIDHAAACGRVVIEEFLDGPEVSLFAITDGATVLPLQPAQDFKRALDGDEGPNTGGMGAYTPLPWAPDDLVEEVSRRVLAADRRRDGAPRHAVPGPALRRPRAHQPRAYGSSSSTPASATPRPSRCWPLLRTPLAALLHGAATGSLAEVGLPAVVDRRRRSRSSSPLRTTPRAPPRATSIERPRPRRRRSTASTSSMPARRSATARS